MNFPPRVHRLISELGKNKLDGFLACTTNKILSQRTLGWLSGLEDFDMAFAVLHSDGELLLTVRDFEVNRAKKHTFAKNIVPRNDFSPALAHDIAERLRELRLEHARIGYDDNDTESAIPFELTRLLPSLNLVPFGEEICWLRQIKDQDEINKLQKACDIASRTIEHIPLMFKMGWTEIQLAQAILNDMVKQGGSFPCAKIGSGKRTSSPHVQASSKHIKSNSNLLCDIWCNVGVFASDLTRVFSIGKLPGVLKEAYSVVLEAQTVALDAVRDGADSRKVDTSAREVIRKSKFKRYIYTHTLGHPVGRAIGFPHDVGARLHEKGVKFMLKKNMCYSVEPGVYIPNVGGIRIEDIITVTKNGYKLLTKVSRDFIQI